MTLASPNSSHADLLHTSFGCLVSERPALLIHDCHGSTAAKCVILAPYLLQLNRQYVLQWGPAILSEGG